MAELRDERNGIEYTSYEAAQNLRKQGVTISRRSWKGGQVVTPNGDIAILDSHGKNYNAVTCMNGNTKKYAPGKDDETATDWYNADDFGHT